MFSAEENSVIPLSDESTQEEKIEADLEQLKEIPTVLQKRQHLIECLTEFIKFCDSLGDKPIYQNGIEAYLEAFQTTFVHSDQPELVISLPTANMFRHPDSLRHDEKPERMIAALRGLIDFDKPVKMIYKNDEKTEAQLTPFINQFESSKKIAALKTAKTFAREVVLTDLTYNDTWINCYSLQTAHDTAALTIETVKQSIQLKTNGLCILRAPGHHANKDSSEGFCLFNNVIYGAAEAAKSIADCKKIVILDIDIHSGNGTQEYVESWKQPAPLYFINMYHPTNYPYDRTAKEEKQNAFIYEIPVLPAKKSDPLEIVKNAEEFIINAIFKKFEAINPQSIGVILVSLGVDGHKDDPIGDYVLTQEFYETVFQRLKTISTLFDIPIITIMEGGYNLKVIEAIFNLASKALQKPGSTAKVMQSLNINKLPEYPAPSVAIKPVSEEAVVAVNPAPALQCAVKASLN